MCSNAWIRRPFIEKPGRRVWFKEELHQAGKQHSVGFFELLSKRASPALDTNGLFRLLYNWSIVEVAHNCGAHHIGTLNFRCSIHVGGSLLGVLCLKFECPNRLQGLRRERYIDQKRQSVVRNRNRKTCCLYKIERAELVEHISAVGADVLLSSCMETCEEALSRCYI